MPQWIWLTLSALAIALFYSRIRRRAALRRRAEMRHFDKMIDSIHESQRQDRDTW